MTKYLFQKIKEGISDASEAIRDKDIFYKCTKCGDIIPSCPKDNIRCTCFNIDIDKDMNRLFVKDPNSFTILKKIKKE